MMLVHQHVIVDVSDGERAVAPDQPHDLAQVSGLHGCEPFVALAPVPLHRRHEEAQIPGRDVGQGVGPVFEHALVDALGLAQIGTGIGRNAVPENVVMAALDHVDGVDLHITEVLDGRRRRRRPLSERRLRVEPLRAQPDMPGCGLGHGNGFSGAGHCKAI
jgi:hypothetical protein